MGHRVGARWSLALLVVTLLSTATMPFAEAQSYEPPPAGWEDVTQFLNGYSAAGRPSDDSLYAKDWWERSAGDLPDPMCEPGEFAIDDDRVTTRYVYRDPVERASCGGFAFRLPALEWYETITITFDIDIDIEIGSMDDVWAYAELDIMGGSGSSVRMDLHDNRCDDPGVPASCAFKGKIDLTAENADDGLEMQWMFRDERNALSFEAAVQNIDVRIWGSLTSGTWAFGAPEREPPFEPTPYWNLSGHTMANVVRVPMNWSVGLDWLDPMIGITIPALHVPFTVARDGEDLVAFNETPIRSDNRYLDLRPYLLPDVEHRLDVYHFEVVENRTRGQSTETTSAPARVFRIGPLPTSLVLALPAIAALPAAVNVLGRNLDRHGMTDWRRRYGFAITGLAALWLGAAWSLGRQPLLAGGLVWPPTLPGGSLLLIILSLVTAFLMVWLLSERARRVIVAQAVTAGDQAREEATGLRARAEQLETYVHSVTHDLKTPLIALDWLTRDLEKELRSADPAALDNTLARIRKNVGGMDRMVKDLLEISSVENDGIAPTEPVALAALAHAVVEELDEPIRRTGTKVHIHEPGLTTVLGDPLRLHQVLRNLIGNAVKYGGGHVQVHGRDLGRPGTPGAYELHIDDDGPGIPLELRTRVFDLFDRGEASTDTEGTGLGLALVRRIVESHDGTVRVEDAPGGGARFVVVFPAHRAVPPPSGP